MFLLDRIRNWRLKNKIPKYTGGQFRYDFDGLTKISVVDSEEVKKYNYARNRQKEREDNERL